MIVRTFLFAAMAFLSVLPARAAAPDAAIANAIEAHITFLADDLLEGRGTGAPGYDLAARYVAAQFRQLGLRPAGDSNTWFQSVPLLESHLVSESTRFELRSDGQTNALDYNLDYVARPHFAETNCAVTAPLVFVGYGVDAPEFNYDDFAGADVRGKIAVFFMKAPPRFPTTALAHYAERRERARRLIARGAVGLIAVPTPKDIEETPWPRRWVQADGTPADAFPEIRANLSVSPQGAGKLFARAPKTLPDAVAAATRSEPQSFPLNLTATITTRSEHRRLASPNVLAVLPGNDPKIGRESIIFTAHLDHQGRGPAINGDAIYNGAYDNAIGIAMMLEAARLLAAEEKGLRRTLVFAAVTAEEKGLVGSEFLAGHLPPPAGRPVANLNLDMVLVTAPTRSFTVLGVEHSTLRLPVEAAAEQFGLQLKPDPQPERVTFVRSDQYSFIRLGIPAIFPKAFAETNALPGTAWITPEAFVKEHYHRPSDDLSLPRDSASAVRFVRFMADIARRVANADEAPRWNAGDFFGEKFGKSRGK
jgi:Zn-dependent M28 family amino/carboxypeptidase